jgi:hypothetical protein
MGRGEKGADVSAMPNVIVLLGAGFSKNWNGLIARERRDYDLMPD